MLTRGATSSVFIAAISWGCYQDLPCEVDSECQALFGEPAVCADRQTGIGKHCYYKGTTSPPPPPLNTVRRTCNLSAQIILAKNAEANANFGDAVAVSGTNILAGSPGFKTTVGDAEIVSLAQPDSPKNILLFQPSPTDQRVGYGVAINNERALVVGKRGAYFFEKSGPGWTALPATTTPSTESWERGAAIGDGFAFANSYQSGGTSTTYFMSTFQWESTPTKCNTPFIAAEEKFANSLSASGDWLAVGTHGAVDGKDSGACVFNYKTALCGGRYVCSPLNPNANTTVKIGFGASVAVSGSLLVVGAPLQQGGPQLPFFAFENAAAAWNLGVQPDTLNASKDAYGESIALDGDLLAVGAPEADDKKGAARIYQWLDRTWILLAELPPPGTNPQGVDFSVAGTIFGRSVAVSGDLVVIGAPGATITGSPTLVGAGALAVYRCPPNK